MKQGFTLVELAIVLVIIGLLVSGILAGRELIEQGKIRAQIRQLAEFDTARETFRAKYNALPGDMINSYGGVFSTCAVWSPSTPGNGIIEDALSNIPIKYIGCEPCYFFNNLSQAKLIAPLATRTPNTYIIGETSPILKLSLSGITIGSNTDGYLWYFIGISDDDLANYSGLTSL